MKTNVNVNSITVMSTEDLALLLTAYERFGSVSRDDLIECIADELEITLDLVPFFNDWCSEMRYHDAFYPIAMMEDELEHMTGPEAFRLAYSSEFSWADDYYQWTGDGNVKSYTETGMLREIADNDDFKKAYVEAVILDDLDVNAIIAECNALIKEGY